MDMEFLASLTQIVLCVLPLAALAAWVSTRGIFGMRGLVGPWRSDPWPVWVQEEDPDAPWGQGRAEPRKPDATSISTAEIDDLPTGARDVQGPEVARLHGSVHRPH
jgi:hypothetical protein